MNDMIEVKTANLIGLALDYATGIADGRELELPGERRGRTCIVWCDPFVIRREGNPDFHDKTRRKWQPSTEWSDGGPLIEKYRINVHHYTNFPDCFAEVLTSAERGTTYTLPKLHSETPLIAACRALVASKIGAVVRIPKELMP